MMKTLYIIPGFGETTKSPGYKKIITAGQHAGYKVVEHNPIWNRKTIDHWLNDFLITIEKKDIQNMSVLGFSFGAYIAVLASQRIRFNKVILCSLSPYFSEDKKFISKEVSKILGKNRINAFFKNKSPKKMDAHKVYMLAGAHDLPYMIKRVQKIYEDLKNKKEFFIIPNTEHTIATDEYYKRIDSILSKKRVDILDTLDVKMGRSCQFLTYISNKFGDRHIQIR